MMTIKEAISARHMVRRYIDKHLTVEQVNKLNARIAQANAANGTQMKLVTGSGKAIWGLMRLFVTRGVSNYVILGAQDTPDAAERLGYAGCDVMLYAQTLGLNTWWVGGTCNKGTMVKESGCEVVYGALVIGYGETNGVQHLSKKPEEVSEYVAAGEKTISAAPKWFREGVAAALLAPTARNKQSFMIKGSGSKVSITCDNGPFSGLDLGIVKYHFEAGAGEDNFEWE